MPSWMPERHRLWWVVGATTTVIVAAVAIPVTVLTSGSGSTSRSASRPAISPVPSSAAAGTSMPTSSSSLAIPRPSSSSTAARAPSVASPTLSTSTTLPVAAAGTGGLAPALQPGQALPAVAPLKTVRSADAVVELPGPITPAETQALTRLQGLTAVEEVDIGTVHVKGDPLVVLGVDPGTFREFTPQVTAAQDQLWSYVAAGSLVADYDSASAHALSAGQAVSVLPVGGTRPAANGWLGALASLGLPGIDLVVDNTYAPALGMTLDNGLIVSAPGIDPYSLQGLLSSALHGAGIELLHAAP